MRYPQVCGTCKGLMNPVYAGKVEGTKYDYNPYVPIIYRKDSRKGDKYSWPFYYCGKCRSFTTRKISIGAMDEEE